MIAVGQASPGCLGVASEGNGVSGRGVSDPHRPVAVAARGGQLGCRQANQATGHSRALSVTSAETIAAELEEMALSQGTTVVYYAEMAWKAERAK